MNKWDENKNICVYIYSTTGSKQTQVHTLIHSSRLKF